MSSSQFSDTFLCFSALDYPVEHLPDNLTARLIGTVNGIVCISDSYKETLILFNPETKTNRLIPSIPSNMPDYDDMLVSPFNPLGYTSFDHIDAFGFGYNEDEDDYKLLRIIECYLDGVKESRELRLYSLKNDSWKNVEDNCDCYDHQLMEGVFVNGCLYFTVSDENGNAMVKCFNLKDETFSVFDMFQYDEGFENLMVFWKELGGCLCVMANYQSSDRDMPYEWLLNRADLWVRKEENWVRLFIVGGVGMIGSWTHIRPVVYERGGRRILVVLDGHKFGWYDWERGKFEEVKASGLSHTFYDTYTYVSSLVALRSDKEKLKDGEQDTVKGKSVSKKSVNKNDGKGTAFEEV